MVDVALIDGVDHPVHLVDQQQNDVHHQQEAKCDTQGLPFPLSVDHGQQIGGDDIGQTGRHQKFRKVGQDQRRVPDFPRSSAHDLSQDICCVIEEEDQKGQDEIAPGPLVDPGPRYHEQSAQQA